MIERPSYEDLEERIVELEGTLRQYQQAEEEFKETERLLEFTLFTVHQARIAVFWAHSDGRFFYVNDMACEWLQYSREELLAMHVADINPEFPREAWEDHWNDIKENGLVQMESTHCRKNGEIYPVEIYSNYVEFEGKEYKLAFVHDISARKRAEEEKVILEERLRQSQKMEAIGTLAGGVAHDFNNLLSPILGYAEMLQEDLVGDDPSLTRVNEIYKAGMRARNLTKQLLSFGRKQPLEIRYLNLNQIIDGLEKMLLHAIREDVIIEKHLASSLPAVEGDVGQVEQVILNLVVNAQDAMPDGGTLTIETKEVLLLDDAFPEFQMDGGRPGPYVMVAVSDTGHGMDKDTLIRIFEPFYTTKEKGKGTGLGLATTYGIVKQHGGNIWAYSEPNKGTTFKVYLPQSEKYAEEINSLESQSEPAYGEETILIVEDQEQVLILARQILQSFGYTVLEASDGLKAIELAETVDGPIQLLLTDVVMPNMNGRELYQQLSKTRPEMRVLYMSGYTDNVIVHHGVMDRDVDFIPKPFGVQELASKVRDVLDRSKSMQEQF